MAQEYQPLPAAFLWRRLQSLMGLLIVFFLVEHLFTNSQAALLIGDDGSGFVRAVNFIKNLPYLPLIEITLLGIPFLIHIVWGIHYLTTSEQNSYGDSGNSPYLPYPRNRSYTWQRLTSWVLLVGVVAHVVQMRFVDYPTSAKRGAVTYYATGVAIDPGIYTLAERLGVSLYTAEELEKEKKKLLHPAPLGSNLDAKNSAALLSSIQELLSTPEKEEGLQTQKIEQEKEWIAALESWPLAPGRAVAAADNFGTIELLMVRETFKSPLYILLYTLFVLAACYHGFNGLWTFCITWGITLSDRSQDKMRTASRVLMALIAFLGLAAIWGTYWINLKQ